MRIIGGTFKGKKLISPANNHIRPTTDRMRESLFNMLEHGSGPGILSSKILDIFAGSGALGIESLSRGAAHITFVDNDLSSCQLIKQNLALIGNPENSSMVHMDALKFNKGVFDIIFIDPPYHKGLIAPLLESIYDNKMMTKNAIVVVEYASGEKIDFSDHFKEIKSRKMGDATFSILEPN